mgnify:CR=1 FL=1
MKTKLHTTEETAKILGIQKNTLEGWRTRGVGPKFRKIGSLVRYTEGDVEDYLAAQTRRSTSEVA